MLKKQETKLARAGLENNKKHMRTLTIRKENMQTDARPLSPANALAKTKVRVQS